MVKYLISKLSNTFLAMVSLPMTILGTYFAEVKSEESKGLYLTGNIGTSSFTSADWKGEVSGLAYSEFSNVFWNDLIDYVNQRFGLEIPKDILTDEEREEAILIGDLKFDDGTGWELGLGYDFGRFRSELSYGNSNNDIKSISVKINEGILSDTSVEQSASGDLNISSILINGYLDFPIGKQKKLTPYLGAGIGGSKLSIDNITLAGEELESANTWLFGYQAKLGLSYSLNKGIDIFGEGIYSAFSDLGAAGEKYGLGSNSDINYRAGFRLRF